MTSKSREFLETMYGSSTDRKPMPREVRTALKQMSLEQFCDYLLIRGCDKRAVSRLKNALVHNHEIRRSQQTVSYWAMRTIALSSNKELAELCGISVRSIRKADDYLKDKFMGIVLNRSSQGFGL